MNWNIAFKIRLHLSGSANNVIINENKTYLLDVVVAVGTVTGVDVIVVVGGLVVGACVVVVVGGVVVWVVLTVGVVIWEVEPKNQHTWNRDARLNLYHIWQPWVS